MLPTQKDPPPRRGIIATLLLGCGLLAGYGLGLAHFFRYLVPLRRSRRADIFVGTLKDFPVGASRVLQDPSGQNIAVARTSDATSAAGFRALSSRCPHLGCNVHWDAGRGEFICPCHNGVFDKNGVAVSGPPAAEGKNLTEFPVRVDADRGWVFVQVSIGGSYGG